MRLHVCSRMAQGPVCDVNTQAARSLHCYYPVCIISLINCSHQRRCSLKYFHASVQVKESGVGRGSSGLPPFELLWGIRGVSSEMSLMCSDDWCHSLPCSCLCDALLWSLYSQNTKAMVCFKHAMLFDSVVGQKGL